MMYPTLISVPCEVNAVMSGLLTRYVPNNRREEDETKSEDAAHACCTAGCTPRVDRLSCRRPFVVSQPL
jgi:hypothetical protein